MKQRSQVPCFLRAFAYSVGAQKHSDPIINSTLNLHSALKEQLQHQVKYLLRAHSVAGILGQVLGTVYLNLILSCRQTCEGDRAYMIAILQRKIQA